MAYHKQVTDKAKVSHFGPLTHGLTTFPIQVPMNEMAMTTGSNGKQNSSTDETSMHKTMRNEMMKR